MKRVMVAGILRLKCPQCETVLEVPLGVVDAFGDLSHRASADHHRLIEFVAEAPLLHAKFWGHVVRCHQPNPNPYIPGGGADTASTPKIGPADAQPRESATEPGWFTLQQEFAAADYLESRLAAADMPAGAGWCLDLTRRMIRALNGREPDA